jgi:hypothetical protein
MFMDLLLKLYAIQRTRVGHCWQKDPTLLHYTNSLNGKVGNDIKRRIEKRSLYHHLPATFMCVADSAYSDQPDKNITNMGGHAPPTRKNYLNPSVGLHIPS